MPVLSPRDPRQRPELVRQRSHAQRCLAVLASTAATGAAWAAAERIGLDFPCPFRSLTGWWCPLCGSTHLAWALAAGNVPAAWRANEVVLVLAGVLAVLAGVWVLEILGLDLRRPRLRPGDQRRVYLGALVLGIGWTLVRNLVPGLVP